MTPYSLLVFLHVLGAVGMFTAWGIEGVALAQLGHAATSMDAKSAIGLRRKIVPGAMAAMLTAIVTGIWMMLVRVGQQPWEVGAVVALVAIAVVGIAFDRQARPRLIVAIAEHGDRLPAHVRSTSESLALSLRLRMTLGVAILALMAGKPNAPWSLAIVTGAALACLAFIFRSSRGRTLAGRRA